MKPLRIFCIIAIVCIITGKQIVAQSAGINLSVGFPQGEFYKEVKRTAIGGNLEFFFIQPREHFPFSFGVDFGYYNYGYESEPGRYYDGYSRIDANISRTNNIARFNLIFRIQPNTDEFRPYLDLVFGPSYIYTRTSVTNDLTGEDVTGENNWDKWVWSYGAGIGVLYKLVGNNNESANVLDAVYLDLKVRYLMSTNADYLKEGSIQMDPATREIYYLPSKSKIDYLTVSIGAQVYFSSFFDTIQGDSGKTE